VLIARFFWLTLFQNNMQYCKTCGVCKAYGKRAFPHIELHPLILTRAFEKWDVDFVGLFLPSTWRNKYIIITTDYMMKWAKATAVRWCI
jgi:hypothetical protein